ncbi:MAG: diaminopimelate decarboxylase, partial [Acidimicrobiia bacterium]
RPADNRSMTGAGPVSPHLLPATARLVGGAGRLSIGGCDLEELADELGTPLFVYDEAHLRNTCREYRKFFAEGSVAYAGKAFLCRAMARLVAEEGLHLDVATGGELYVALTAGFPAERLILHGNNKSVDELEAALLAGVGRIVVDCHEELDRIVALVAHGKPAPRVLMRVTPGVEARTHEHVETGHEDSKFGFQVTSGAALEACRRAAGTREVQFLGIHCHIGSQLRELGPVAEAAGIVASLASDLAGVDVGVTEVNLGGGLGVAYVDGDRTPSVEEYAGHLQSSLLKAFARVGVPEPDQVLVEPGRSIAGPAGVTLYRVGAVKPAPQGRVFVAVDGGMSDNPRPATYGAGYEAFLPARAGDPRPIAATVVGKHCEQGDLLVREAWLPAGVGVDDVLCTPVTGAYGYSMASNYNKVPRPAVAFVAQGAPRLVVRRETFEDLVRLEVG